MDSTEGKPELELNKKSKSIVIHPLEVDYKEADNDQFEFTLRNERLHLSCKQPREATLLDPSDDTTLAILRSLDLDMQFYGFIFTAIRRKELIKGS